MHQQAASYIAAYQGMMEQSYLQSIPEDFWVPILRNSMQRGDTCFVAMLDNAIIGNIVFGASAHKKYPKSAELYAIYFLPEYTGRGLGNLLYAKAEESMIKQGFSNCILEVLATKQPAIAFYKKHNYRWVNTFTVEENGMVLTCNTMTKNLL